MKHIVGFSGGIDSQATARWVLNRFPREDVILLNSLAGRNEHPLTVEFIEWYSATVHPVTTVTPLVSDLWKTDGFAEKNVRAVAANLTGEDELTFERLIQIKGRPPSRKRQFCTTFLKLVPSKRWIDENIKGDYCRYSGVRWDESNDRASRKAVEFDEWFDCDLFHPVIDWTKQMCFDYVKAHGEQVNPLYAMGFNRVGCAPCINSGKDDILEWALRFPEMIDKVRGWEERQGRTFFAPKVPGLSTNTVDQVVEWAKTERGGRQIGLKVLQDRSGCSSDFGLCE
jgi:3'-phosphoadenosine 5'-phosphosulfate sulfotransferase (PAPS reductase)/FAD synthetase